MAHSKCKVTKEEFIEKLIENKGVAYKTYHELNVPYSVYWKWLNTDDEFAEQVKRAREITIQYAETKMLDLIERGDGHMIRFLLATKGGYNTTKNVNVTSSNTVDVNGIIDDIKQDLND